MTSALHDSSRWWWTLRSGEKRKLWHAALDTVTPYEVGGTALREALSPRAAVACAARHRRRRRSLITLIAVAPCRGRQVVFLCCRNAERKDAEALPIGQRALVSTRARIDWCVAHASSRGRSAQWWSGTTSDLVVRGGALAPQSTRR
jgi:hypothetical protein